MDPGVADPLYAERALFHHPSAANGHVRVELILQRRRPLEVVPVEPPHLVWAVVGTVTRADAAVVYLHVEPFFAVGRGVNRAHRFAGRGVAVLAEHGLVISFWIVEIALIVAIDAYPVHFPLFEHLLFADHRDVVFRLAGDNAGVAAHARR